MTNIEKIPAYGYKFDSGPVPEAMLGESISEGNCRLLLQMYFYIAEQRYLSEEELLNPRGFTTTGSFLKINQSDNELSFEGLDGGSVIYGEKIRDATGNPVDFSPRRFPTHNDYLVRLHTAIYSPDSSDLLPFISDEVPMLDTRLGEPAILHATSIQGSVALWSLEKFVRHYKPIAAKKF